MARQEHVAGRPEVNVESIDLAGNQRLRIRLGVAVTGANDSLSKIASKSAGVHIDEFGGEVCLFTAEEVA